MDELDVPLTTGGTEALGERTPAKLELWLNATVGNIDILFGSAMCVGINPTVDKDDVTKLTYSFTGEDTLAYGTIDPVY